MITSEKDYNELLYVINDPNFNAMIPLEVGADGYPDISEDGIYFYSTDYTLFRGTADDVKEEWATNELPSFYYVGGSGNMIKVEEYDEDGYPVFEEGKVYYYKYNYVPFQGTPEELRQKWPNASNLPTFFVKQLDRYYRIPYDEPVYEIDLDTRTVKAPEFLSVLEDHNAEVIWFKVNRFYDDVDLYGSTCWIQFKNALKESYISVTIPKVIVESNHDILYIPWPISGCATKAAGTIEFSFQFFKMSEDKQRVFYTIHTKPASSKILHGLHVDPFGEINEDSENDPQLLEIERMLRELTEKYSVLRKDYELYWYEAK